MGLRTAVSTRAGPELLEFAAVTFRENLSRASRVPLELMKEYGYDAHHGLPQATFRRLKNLGFSDDLATELINNPYLGQWIERGQHIAMHVDGYNKMWDEFLKGLEGRNLSPSEVTARILHFMETDVVQRYGQYGMTKPPFAP